MKDMRFGYTLDDEWLGRDPDAAPRGHRQQMPLLDGVGYYFIAACVTRDPMHPLDRSSATCSFECRAPPAWRRSLPSGAIPLGSRLRRLHHFNLGSHPDVYEVIRESIEWLPGSRGYCLRKGRSKSRRFASTRQASFANYSERPRRGGRGRRLRPKICPAGRAARAQRGARQMNWPRPMSGPRLSASCPVRSHCRTHAAVTLLFCTVVRRTWLIGRRAT